MRFYTKAYPTRCAATHKKTPCIPSRFAVLLYTRLGDVAQLVRALRSHRRGRGFESLHPHHKKIHPSRVVFFVVFLMVGLETALRNRSSGAILAVAKRRRSKLRSMKCRATSDQRRTPFIPLNTDLCFIPKGYVLHASALINPFTVYPASAKHKNQYRKSQHNRNAKQW